jgi:AraC family transcriptional regulator
MVVEMSSRMLATRLIQNYVDRNLVNRITGAARSLDHARMRRVLDYIDQNLEEEFTISDLARRAHLSVFHFARMFANTMGAPPQRYVSQRRLESAKKMFTPVGFLYVKSHFAPASPHRPASRARSDAPPI